MSKWLFLSLSANVYCLVMGEFSTNDRGPLLTSNGTTDKAGTCRSVPGGGFSVLGMRDSWQKLQGWLQTYFHDRNHVDGSMHIPLWHPCLSPRPKVMEKKSERPRGVLLLWLKCNPGLLLWLSALINPLMPTVLCCTSSQITSQHLTCFLHLLPQSLKIYNPACRPIRGW